MMSSAWEALSRKDPSIVRPKKAKKAKEPLNEDKDVTRTTNEEIQIIK